MLMPDRSHLVPVDAGVELHAIEWDGDDPAFVLVHGLASNARLWDGVAAELAAAGHRVLAVDQRGHGRSSKPSSGYDLASVTDDLRALLGHLDVERPVLVGQSWGGNVVIEFAARFPNVAAAVGCIDGGAIHLARRFPDWESCAHALRPPPLVGTPLEDIEDRLRAAHPDWPEAGIRGTLACFEVRDDGTVAPWLHLDHHLQVLRGLWQHDPSVRFPQISCPVLFLVAVGGDDESRSPYEQAEKLLDDARVEWIVGDHDLHAQHPVAVAELLRPLAGGRRP